jgi:hypothetical protein
MNDPRGLCNPSSHPHIQKYRTCSLASPKYEKNRDGKIWGENLGKSGDTIQIMGKSGENLGTPYRLNCSREAVGKIGTLIIFRFLSSPLTEEQRAKNG